MRSPKVSVMSIILLESWYYVELPLGGWNDALVELRDAEGKDTARVVLRLAHIHAQEASQVAVSL